MVALLASCYTSCLDLAAERGLRCVAFCCISTGVFGYPAPQAALTAVRAVASWLHRNARSGMRVVFDTFTAHDAALYRDCVLWSRPARNLFQCSCHMSSPLVAGLLRSLWEHFDDAAVASLFPADDEYNDMRGIRVCAAGQRERCRVWDVLTDGLQCTTER